MGIQLDMIGIVTADLASSLRFYRLLGMPVADTADDHVECTLPSGLRIGWDTEQNVRSFQPDWQAPQGNPRTALAFLCATPSEVDSTYAQLIDAGYRGQHEPWDAFWGQRYCTVLDPDDNPVDLFSPL